MTRTQRQVHRWTWTILAPLLFIAVLGALVSRPTPVVQPPLPITPTREN